MSRSAKQGTRLDPAIRRAQIVEAATHTFHGRAPSIVSLEEVSDVAGVFRSLVALDAVEGARPGRRSEHSCRDRHGRPLSQRHK